MDCIEAKNMFSLYLDGELKQKDEAMFGEHISTCGTCSAEILQIKAACQLLRRSAAKLIGNTSFTVFDIKIKNYLTN